MIKTKSCKVANSRKQTKNVRAGYDYNPALQNLQCLILGLTKISFNNPLNQV